MADLLNARWIEMMEKMQTDSTQGKQKKYHSNADITSGVEPWASRL
jgi:hypothetical protein